MERFAYNCKFCGFELSKEDYSCPSCNRETSFAWNPPEDVDFIDDELEIDDESF